MKINAANLISTWFGCGFAPAGAGTVASVVALAMAWVLVRYAGWRPLWFLLLAAVMTLPSIWAAGRTAAECKQKDPGLVVVDEVIGQWIALAGAQPFNWKTALAAFALFRLFDIWKPPPVRGLEALPSGVGIVADDVMAGVYGALVLFLAGCFYLY